jgi:hypothetical protein
MNFDDTTHSLIVKLSIENERLTVQKAQLFKCVAYLACLNSPMDEEAAKTIMFETLEMFLKQP